jgi:hypothetical protein
MQNAAASNTTADNLAVLIDMGFSEEQSKEVNNTSIRKNKHFVIDLGFTSSGKFRRCDCIFTE